MIPAGSEDHRQHPPAVCGQRPFAAQQRGIAMVITAPGATLPAEPAGAQGYGGGSKLSAPVAGEGRHLRDPGGQGRMGRGEAMKRDRGTLDHPCRALKAKGGRNGKGRDFRAHR